MLCICPLKQLVFFTMNSFNLISGIGISINFLSLRIEFVFYTNALFCKPKLLFTAVYIKINGELLTTIVASISPLEALTSRHEREQVEGLINIFSKIKKNDRIVSDITAHSVALKYYFLFQLKGRVLRKRLKKSVTFQICSILPSY